MTLTATQIRARMAVWNASQTGRSVLLDVDETAALWEAHLDLTASYLSERDHVATLLVKLTEATEALRRETDDRDETMQALVDGFRERHAACSDTFEALLAAANPNADYFEGRAEAFQTAALIVEQAQ